jgi:hypothetical protein
MAQKQKLAIRDSQAVETESPRSQSPKSPPFVGLCAAARDFGD